MKERLIKEKSVKFSYAGLVSQRNVVQILEVGGKVRSKPRDPSNPIHATFSTLVDDKHIPSIGLSDGQMAFRFIGTASDEYKQTCRPRRSAKLKTITEWVNEWMAVAIETIHCIVMGAGNDASTGFLGVVQLEPSHPRLRLYLGWKRIKIIVIRKLCWK